MSNKSNVDQVEEDKPLHTICANCQSRLEGPFCHQCGQQTITKRWTSKILFGQFIQQFTNIERGFLYTTEQLFRAPGQLIRDYWRGSTVNYYNPFRYVLIWTAANILLNFWLGIDELFQASLEPAAVKDTFGAQQVEAADQQFDSWLNILVLLLIPVHSWMSKWLFQKHGQNYAEHLILNAYILGQLALVGCGTILIFYWVPDLISVFLIVNFLIGVVYNSYVFKSLFQEPWRLVVLKAFVIGVVGLVAFFAMVILFSSIALLAQ